MSTIDNMSIDDIANNAMLRYKPKIKNLTDEIVEKIEDNVRELSMELSANISILNEEAKHELAHKIFSLIIEQIKDEV